MPKGPGGVILWGRWVIAEPAEKRAISFFDGQNLFRHAMAAFGHYHPNYDPLKLHKTVCHAQGWKPVGCRFYTGVPSREDSEMWHGYWASRFLAMRRADILVEWRALHYRTEEVDLPDGTKKRILVGQEKGIDIRLALDLIRLVRQGHLDVGIIFSQDQDLCEVVEEVKDIARQQNKWVKLVCAFPAGPRATAKRGIDKTDWFRMDQAFYEACLDPRDYRPKRK